MRSLLTVLMTAVATPATAVALASHSPKAATGRASAATATLNVRSAAYGKILVNGNGRTLYLWEKDVRRARASACDSECEAVWPFVLVKGKPKAGTGVEQKLLGTITVRGREEVTYNGWPLYTFSADKQPGETKGEGKKSFGATWWMISPAGWAVEKGRYESHPVYRAGATVPSPSSSRSHIAQP